MSTEKGERNFEVPKDPDDAKKREGGKLAGERGEGFVDVSESDEGGKKERIKEIKQEKENSLEGKKYIDRVKLCREIEDCMSSPTEDELIRSIENLKERFIILSPTQLIENEAVHSNPKNKDEHKENILAKLKKLNELRDLEEEIIKKKKEFSSEKVDDVISEFLVNFSPAAIDIPEGLKIWEVLELLKDPMVFSDSYSKEIGGHYEEDEDKIWVTVGHGGTGNNSCSQGVKYEAFPPERISINANERKTLKNPIFFHTHPKEVRFDPTPGADEIPKYDINKLNIEKPFIERNVLISEKLAETIFWFWTNVYLPGKTEVYSSRITCNYELDSGIRDHFENITDEYWRRKIRLEDWEEVRGRQNIAEETMNEIRESLKTEKEKRGEISSLEKEVKELKRSVSLSRNAEEVLREDHPSVNKINVKEKEFNSCKDEARLIEEKIEALYNELEEKKWWERGKKKELENEISVKEKEEERKESEIKELEEEINKLKEDRGREVEEAKSQLEKYGRVEEIQRRLKEVEEELLKVYESIREE